MVKGTVAAVPGKTYRIVPQKDLTYGVEITTPNTYPGTVPGFRTEEEAEAWIAEQKAKDVAERKTT
jgi:hypothetical protein